MKLSSAVFSTVFAILVLTANAYAGPRPQYKDVSDNFPLAKQYGIIKGYPGNFTKPVPGGAASLKDFSSAMPPARLDSGFTSNKPYPTNKWYTSIFTNSNDGAASFNSYWGNRIFPSPMQIVFDSGFPWSVFSSWGGGWGYSVGGQGINVNTSSHGGAAIKVNNIMAFSVQGAIGSGVDDVIKAGTTTLKSYGDWSFTSVLQHNSDSSKRMTSTFGKGFVFTYNYFTVGVNPRLRMKYLNDGSQNTYFYNNSGTLTQILAGGPPVATDSIMIKNYIVSTSQGGTTYQYFGVYAPAGTVFTISASSGEFCDITLNGTSENERYLSIALLKSPSLSGNDDDGAFLIFKDYYEYAYNFITDTQVTEWNYNRTEGTLTTTFRFTFDKKRTGGVFVPSQTVFALYPHQYKNLTGSLNKTYTYNSIRGLLKVSAGDSFQTKHKFNGVLPFLMNEVPSGDDRTQLQTYINYDKNFNPANARIDETKSTGDSNTYYHGKALARAANLIPVFDKSGDLAARNSMIKKLKDELLLWYSGQNSSKYFAYDAAWGGIVGSNPGGRNDFGASKFNDHHFHYGYFIYASAILAMYDPSFAQSSQGMVDLLVREMYNPDRDNASFPFLRYFDVYEGHSWANGRGGGDRDFGNDEESTAEAMNAWAGIILWGLATGNDDWIKLGVYGYTTQYEAAKNYYLNIDGDIWNPSDFGGRISAGMLFDGQFNWGLWWDPKITQTVMGIQVLPLTPSSLYLGYDVSYSSAFYNYMWTNRDSGKNNFWKDIWLRFRALYDAPGALAEWDSVKFSTDFPDTWRTTGFGDDGSSLSFSYHFIRFFNSLGQVDTEYYADYPAFLVMKKGIDDRTYIAYNPDKTQSKTIKFYKRGVLIPVGTMTVPPSTMFSTKDFLNFKSDSGYFVKYISDDALWNVTMTAPFSAFAQDPQIVITSAVAPALPPGDYDYTGQCFNISVSTAFLASASLTLDYSGVTLPAGINQNDLRLAYVSPSGQIEIIKNAPQGKTIAVNIKKAGTYVLIRSVQPLVWAVYAYPNPYKTSRHGSSGITFANTQSGDRIRIYTIAGEKVFDKAVTSDDFKWNIVNDHGNRIASGIYIYYIESQGKVYKGKIALER